MHRQRLSLRGARGFTLLELVVVVAILVILAGAAIPVTSKVLTYKARQATREELGLLSQAAGEYFRDTWRLPGNIDALVTSGGVAGWSGPYLPGVVADALTGQMGYAMDAWSRAYRVRTSGDTWSVLSAAEDARFGSSDDLGLTLDVTSIRRSETLARLATINQAILLYNNQYQSTAPLPANWTSALNDLVLRGFLPSTAGYGVDGWGDAFVEVPVGVSPVVRVESRHMPSGVIP